MKRKKRLLLIGPLPPPYAGPEMVMMTLHSSKRLSDMYDIKIINTTVRRSNEDKGKLDAVMFSAYIRYLVKLFLMGLTWRPDYVMYSPTSATIKGWMRDGTTLFLSWALRVKSVVLFQGGHFHYFYSSLGTLGQGIIRWLLNRSALVLAQSDALKRQFSDIVPAHRVHRFYNTIDNDFYHNFDGVTRDDRKQEVTILFVGHLSTAKGYCDLLKTVPHMALKHKVKYVLMGLKVKSERNVHFNQVTGERIPNEDPDACYARYVQGNALEASVVFLGGKIYGQDKLRVFKEADIFVLPSYSEGFSMAILEAMAAGLPVIVTSVGAAPEVIGNGVNGYVIKPGDVQALQYSLDRLVGDHSLRIDMGRRNRELCRERFLSEVGAQNLIDLLEIAS
jgi:glycosyltransferase involved in cell wall biosynthesis